MPANLNWLLVLVLSWLIPVLWPRSYLFSLVFWLLPIAVLLPDFLAATNTPSRRRRRALAYAAGTIVFLGALLDFGLGERVLKFDGEWYWFRIRGVPIEEVLFYMLAPTAILLVYAWCDEHWLAAYNQTPLRDRVLAGQPPLLRLSWGVVSLAVLLLGVATGLKWRQHGQLALPIYATFLTAGAFVPAATMYRSVSAFVNWRAFGATTVYVIGTSLAYEVTVALPLAWWGYRPEATIGLSIARWSAETSIFPLEAVLVWVAAPFSCILTYEFIKAYLHHPAGTAKRRLRGVGGQAR